MDIASLVNGLVSDGTVQRISSNPAAQFGINDRAYLGAQLLPERIVDQNEYREDQITYRSVIANDGTRYSPAQKKGNDLIGSFLVELGNSDIAREFTGRELDALIRILERSMTEEAAVSLTNWLEKVINIPLIELNELQRWQAIVNALVQRRGDNGYKEDIAYSDPSGHRVTAGGQWSNNSYDLFDDILAQADLLAGKGYTVSRIITPRTVLSIMSNNDKVKTRTGVATINPAGQISATAGRASREAINAALDRDGLPPIETYDLQYRTSTGTGFFLDRGAFVMVAETGRDETIDLGDTEDLVINNTLGYTAVGRPVGQADSGRVIHMEAYSNKPPRIEGEGWQTSLPVITDPEALAVIKGIN